jgi:serine protease Do
MLQVLNCSAQPSLKMLRTIPSKAEVYDEEKNKIGETPFDLSKLKASVMNIQIVKEDYETVNISFTPNQKKGYIFPNSVESCVSCAMIFDKTEPKEPVSGTLRLRKKIGDYEQRLMIAIDTPLIALPSDATLGRVNGEKKELSDKYINRLIGYPENMELQLMNGMKNSYIDAYFISNREKKKTTLYKPKIIFKPVIRDINFMLKGKLLRDYRGPCTMKTIWKVSLISEPDKYLAQIPVETSIYRCGENYDLLLHQLLAESERDLIELDTLYDFLTGIEKSYLAKSKGDVYKLKKEKPAMYVTTKEMLKGVTASVVTIENEDGFGSGAIVSSEGHIITSYHVIEGEKDINVRIGKDSKQKAEIVQTNKDYDLALLKVKSTGLKPLSFGNSDSTGTGDEIFAAGTPIDKSLTQTITRGIISGNRIWNGVNFIQTDVSINSGNSGGPLLNSRGEIIGITTFKALGRGIEGIGFGIPSNVVIEMLNLKFEK